MSEKGEKSTPTSRREKRGLKASEKKPKLSFDFLKARGPIGKKKRKRGRKR